MSSYSASADTLVLEHADVIANRVGCESGQAEAVLRALTEDQEDDVEDDLENTPSRRGGRFGADLLVLQQEVRQELWWILRSTG